MNENELDDNLFKTKQKNDNLNKPKSPTSAFFIFNWSLPQYFT